MDYGLIICPEAVKSSYLWICFLHTQFFTHKMLIEGLEEYMWIIVMFLSAVVMQFLQICSMT